MTEPKQRRSENFTKDEKDVLITCVERHKGVLENKRTDLVTVKEKEDCWKVLAIEFNNEFPSRKRTGAQLKQCWKNIKSVTKKEAASVRRSRFLTGGGPPTSPLNDLDGRVLAIVPEQIHPLSNNVDCDADVNIIEASTSTSTFMAPVISDPRDSPNANDTPKMKTPRPDEAKMEFAEYYRQKRRKLDRESEIMEEHAALKKRCLEKELQIREIELEKLMQDTRTTTSSIIGNAYKHLS